MPKKRSFFHTICCCLCFDSSEPQDPQVQQNQRQQNIPQQPANQRVPQAQQQVQNQQKKEAEIGIKREFELSVGQLSQKEDRLNEEDLLKYKYCCPICLIYFNKILKTKCCNNYVCVECEYDIHQQMLNKKIEPKCWWCKSDQCEIIDVQEGEQIKNYSDAAQELEDNKKQQLELIKSMIQESRVQRMSMMKTFKSQQVDNNTNPLLIKTIQSQNVDNLSNNLGTFNRNQWHNFNVNQQRLEEEDEEEEEKIIDKIGIGKQDNQKFYKTDTFLSQNQEKKIVHKSLNSPNYANKAKNSSLCFNHNGQAVPLDQLQNQNSLFNQYKNLEMQNMQNPQGYFFKQSESTNNNNHQNYKYISNKPLYQFKDDNIDVDQLGKNNNKIFMQNNVSSNSSDDLNSRVVDNQHNNNVPQNKVNEVIYNNNIKIDNNLSDINDRE